MSCQTHLRLGVRHIFVLFGDAESLESVGLDGVASEDLVAVLGVHTDFDKHAVGHLARMREGAVGVRVVGLEKDLADTDGVALA